MPAACLPSPSLCLPITGSASANRRHGLSIIPPPWRTPALRGQLQSPRQLPHSNSNSNSNNQQTATDQQQHTGASQPISNPKQVQQAPSMPPPTAKYVTKAICRSSSM